MTVADFFDLITQEHRVFGLDWSYLVLFGLLGNATFSMRFLVQWVHSERAKRSLIPRVFWHLSIAGSLIMLIYFVLRRDPVGILAYLPNSLVYMRNLQLLKRETEAAS
ncbi:MAG TPA: lipid-A-disaccharide synthase N-terminal domain-containing protein [Candidatus Cybelea sp.]|nr:lipid-A-disaccharide synthase N-terminal domain-containing protein [Candidatus Cybelea sp.]